jgi:hypothetical protein
MTDRSEAGRYSLAGFLYQIVGSGVEGLRIARCKKLGKETEILELEQLGQDLVVGNRLIQFKYSSTNRVVKPSELRTVLQTFVNCVQNASKSVKNCRFELRTNRELHEGIEKWFSAKKNGDRKALQRAIKATSKSTISIDEVCDVFERFEYVYMPDTELTSELNVTAAKLGMLPEEIPEGVTRLIGYLAVKSGLPEEQRRVSASEIRSKFAGHENAWELLSDRSIQFRRNKIDCFQQAEVCKPLDTTRVPIVSRARTDDIYRSVLHYPVVVVHGNGGCGKSIAVADAMMSCLADNQNPPGFSWIGRAASMKSQTLLETVENWRNRSSGSDGAVWSRAIDRLRAAYADTPVLVVCFDGIDEKSSETLEEGTLTLIRELINLAVESRFYSGKPIVSVVLSCRRKDEVSNIPRNLNAIAPPNAVMEICVSDYDEQELLDALQGLLGPNHEVVQEIRAALGGSSLSSTTSRVRRIRRSTTQISSEAIEIISHPVLCFIFSKLSVSNQRRCLTGDHQALHLLGDDYVEWFRKKASCRIPNLKHGECEVALIAASRTFSDWNGIGEFHTNWLTSVEQSIGTRLQAIRLYDEAISAGLILQVDRSVKTWRWRHPWFCRFLAQSEGILS